MLGIIIMMLTISWQLTLVSLVVLPLSAVTVMMIVKKSQKHFKNQQKFLGNVNGHVEEMFGSHTIVKGVLRRGGFGKKHSANTTIPYIKPHGKRTFYQVS